MSILNCYTRLTIINHTGLPAKFTFTPQVPMRLQPLEQANIHGSIETSASNVSEWLKEFIQLLSYGPTYNKATWNIAAGQEETIRVQLKGPMFFEINWTDPSVSWEQHDPGKWSIDISKVTDVTLHLRGDVGEYVQQRTFNGPSTVKSVHLKHTVEIACDEDIPFTIEKSPISKMYWRTDINLASLLTFS